MTPCVLLLQPDLNYLAPELAGGHTDDMSTCTTPACDIFSLALLSYEVLSGSKLLSTKREIVYYKSKVVSLAKETFSGVPPLFEGIGNNSYIAIHISIC